MEALTLGRKLEDVLAAREVDQLDGFGLLAQRGVRDMSAGRQRRLR